MKSFENLAVVQIIEIMGFDHFPSHVVFDINGKMDCLNYFDNLFKALKNRNFVYYAQSDFQISKPYSYDEKFLTIKNGLLVSTDNFDDCLFYERSFFTSDKFRDAGIVPFINYSVLNSG